MASSKVAKNLSIDNLTFSPHPGACNFLDITGQEFGRLIVVGYRGKVGKAACWWCVCQCSTILSVQSIHLRTGHTKSCGCLSRELLKARNQTHGKSKTAEYEIWCGMIKRCRNPKSTYYAHYGGRGIKVCDRWNSFENFLADMGFRPSPKHSIERKENGGNYEPSNCCWSLKKQQMRNTRHNILITYDGLTLCASEWAERTTFTHTMIRKRKLRGWCDACSVTLPAGQSCVHINQLKACIREQSKISENGNGLREVAKTAIDNRNGVKAAK